MRKLSFFIKKSPSGELTLEQGEPLQADVPYVVYQGMLSVPKSISNSDALSVAHSMFETLYPFLSFPTTSS